MRASNAEAQKLQDIVETYYDKYLELNPLTATGQGDHRFDARLGDYESRTWMADSLWIEQEALEQLRTIDTALLLGEDLVTYAMFEYDRKIAVEGFRYPSEWLPINPFANLPLTLALLGSGHGMQPFATVQDYDNFLSRMGAFPGWVDRVIDNMREGIARGVTQPRVLIERTIPQLSSIADAQVTETIFWRPILNFPAGLPVADRIRLIGAYRVTIENELLPAWRRLHDFLADEYLPQARERVGMSEMPNGRSWYAYLARRHTSTDMKPGELHELGLAEVARIREEMDEIRRRVGYEGDLDGFLGSLRSNRDFYFQEPAELFQAYREIGRRVGSGVNLLFAHIPRAGLEIRAVEKFREKTTAPASPQPPGPDGTRPGILYVDTYDTASRAKYAMEALYLQEAVPGRHFQRALAKQSSDLPRVRRYGESTAFGEGWALYAQSLGADLGLYLDPYSQFGALLTELRRATGLVVDTGLHSRGWTRAQAIEYLGANSALDERDIATEVDRCIAFPALALGSKPGQLKIMALRNRARERLGRRFDIREFHSQLLRGGSLPLPVLEARIDRWIDAQG
jgi:uncharacterized protein (DUF885 family)